MNIGGLVAVELNSFWCLSLALSLPDSLSPTLSLSLFLTQDLALNSPTRSKAPPPQRTQSAPPPARQGVFGGSGGFMSTVMQGMAFGGGSAMAHRAVDAVLGSRSYHPAPVEATQAAQTVVQERMECAESAKPFVECMGISNGDMEACRTFFDRLQACRLALPREE